MNMQIKWATIIYFNHWNYSSGLFISHSSIVYESAHLNAAKYFVVSEIRRQMHNRISAITCSLAAIFGALRFLPFSDLWLRLKYDNHLSYSWIEIIETRILFNLRMIYFLSIHFMSFTIKRWYIFLINITNFLIYRWNSVERSDSRLQW